MTSYRANFASHYTRDRHVGFLSAGFGKKQQNVALIFIQFVKNREVGLELLIKQVLTVLIYNFKSAWVTKMSMKSFEFLGQFDLRCIYS